MPTRDTDCRTGVLCLLTTGLETNVTTVGGDRQIPSTTSGLIQRQSAALPSERSARLVFDRFAEGLRWFAFLALRLPIVYALGHAVVQ